MSDCHLTPGRASPNLDPFSRGHGGYTNMKKWLIIILTVFLAACSQKAWIEKFVDADKQKIARDYIQRLQDGDLEALATELDPGLRKGNEVELLRTMRGMMPPGAPTVTDLVGYQTNRTLQDSNYNVTFQFGYDSKWIIVNAAWRERTDTPRQITGMRVVPLERSLQETNAFTFKRAGPTHYLFLAATIIVPLFILTTLVVCIRTRIQRRKWLWIVFVLVGFVQFSFNWTTGAMAYKLLYFQLFGAGAMASGIYMPWIFSFSLPVGAIAFWFKRRQLVQPPPPFAAPGIEQ